MARTPSSARASSVDENALAALRFAVSRLARQLRQEALADGNLTPSKLATLASINRLGPISLRELAEVERVSAPSMTRAVDWLENAGLVRRLSDPADGRMVRVEVTPAAVQFIRQSRQRKEASLSRRIAQLSPQDQKRLLDAIPVLQRLLEDEPVKE